MEILEDGNRNSVSCQAVVSYSGQNTKSQITPLLGAFERKHGNLLHILEVEMQLAALKALVQYYDPPTRCFTFGDFQMAPTLEEYERLLGLPLAESSHPFHQGKSPS
ncbi:hypothetical protein CR513_52889, partial [Mucuna pruriens]